MRELKIIKSITNRSEAGISSHDDVYPKNAEGYLPLPSYVIPIKRTKIPAVDFLKMDFPNHKWNISGGWGYTMDTAVVIEEDRTMHGLSMESMFVQYRTYEELIVFLEAEKSFSGIEWKKLRQSLHGVDGRSYDFIEYLVTAFLDSDWQMLKADWESHNGYIGDREGFAAHQALRKSKQIGFYTICWFDITRFYGK